ncbi:hypothetical protein GPA22_16670 [Aromatoleum toluvorans]|uniref:Uncharacterized protein n=1 Tax=Aromatoleum toluvorans TaxID=92002 RepID=A0ABX1Q4R2_9RHOO|nr:hypothetical protein [Aromatoleum toluvorans]NMG45351.1 hypothetical protein [Aromatoleum toluvorans]
MPEVPGDVQSVFLDRIERRVKILKTLLDAGLGVYQAAEEEKRKRAIETVARMTARTSELPRLTPETLAKACDIIASHLEPMQKVLPHDVQYRNRMRKAW